MKYFAVIALTIILAACASTGTDFKKMTPDKLAYGTSTSVDVVQAQGTPGTTGSKTKNGVVFDFVSYVFADAGGKPDTENVTPARAQSFYFKDDVLVGSEFTSSWESDSTKYDHSKIDMIKKGSTTVGDVIGLIGQPSGEYIYPLVAKEGEHAMVYTYSQTIVSGLDIIAKSKELIVSYDPATNVVTDVEFNQIGYE